MRYARHVALPEIGAAGQTRIEAATLDVRAAPRALETARLYLERAGARVSPEGAPLEAPEVRAGRPELEEAAAFLAGALAAVEAIKRVTGAGEPALVQVVLTGPQGDRG